MSLDPTGEVRLNFQKNAPQRPQRTIFEPRWRLTSLRELTLRRHGFPDHVINDTVRRQMGHAGYILGRQSMSVHFEVSPGAGRRTVCWLVGVVLLGAAAPVAAAEFTIGLGAALAPDYEGSEDYEAAPNWVFRANNLYDPATYVALQGTRLRSNFVPHPQLRAGLSGRFVGERDDVDNGAVDDLDDTDAALMLGAGIGRDFLPEPALGLTLAVDLVYDVANDNGALVTPYLAYFNALPDTPWSVGLELSTTWADEDYMSEQFGINGNNAARSGLDQFDADEGFKDVGLGGQVSYRFTDSWSTTVAGQYKLLVEDAADSPIVDDEGSEHQFVLGATVNFHF